MKKVLVLLLSLSGLAANGQIKTDHKLLQHLLEADSDCFRFFIDHKDELEIQIIYTQIDRTANNVPNFRTYYYNVDSNRYFYPASTVKLPVSLLALEKLRELNIPGVNKFTTMLSDSMYSGQLSVARDTTSETERPSIAHYIKKILVASDNDAYNRLYEFIGQHEANKRLGKKGYHIRLLHRLERSLTPDENRHTERVSFVSPDSVVLYSEPMKVGDSIPVVETVKKGSSFYKGDSLIHLPFDFSYKNFFPLTDQQRVLKSVLFPQSVPAQNRFGISATDRQFVMKYMSQLPAETVCPDYGSDTTYYPAYSKFLMFGNDHDSIPKSIRIFNKIGDAYGYLIDNAYIVDFEHQVEFMLSAVILANTDGTYNDSEYEYKTIGYPFMRELGQMIYRYELKRPRSVRPDLREFKFEYDRTSERESD